MTLDELDNRATSTTLTYVLTLAITTVLMAGLLVGTSGVVDDQQRQSVRNELGVVGERLASEITGVDRLVYISADSEVTLRTDHPARVVNTDYTIAVKVDETAPCTHEQCLVLNSTQPALTVVVPFSTEVAVEEGQVIGGDVVVEYDAGSRTISLRNRA